ncbi:MAG: cytochrome c oxidase subunit II [Salinisphaeraceae bacterium]
MKGLSYLAAALSAVIAGPAAAEWGLNMPKGVTAMTREIYGLHMLIFWICVAIGVVVFGAMIYSLIAHRKSRGVEAAQFHESTSVEIAWTIVPFVILIGMAIPAAGTLIRVEDTSNSDLTVRVTGYQWMWQYEYVDSGVNIYSRLAQDSNAARQLDSGIDPNTVENYLLEVDNRMVVPVDQKVRILLTADDVIHAWWVPELGGKKDAIPGFINEMWFKAEETGVYRGQCSELCGRGHGFMPIVVEVVSQDEFDAWVAENGGDAAGTQTAGAGESASAQETASDAGGESTQVAQADTAGSDAGGGDIPMDTLMSEGEEIYNSQCAACHQADGSGMPAAGFPAMKGSEIATGSLDTHIDRVLNGKGAMPAYKDGMSDRKIAAVITFERNAFGNDTGDAIQPSQIKAKR